MATAHKMDPEFGYFRVTGAADKAEALTAAAEAWPTTFGADPNYAQDDDAIPAFEVESEGWYRCMPCRCGYEHAYDTWPAEAHARGASYMYLIGRARVPA